MNISDIKVLSVFDGMSCGQIALNRANIKYSQYYASEIDKHAIQVTQHNYPDTIQLGDVTKVSGYDLPKIDLFFGGSPCQGFSLVGKMLNFDDPRSKLFFEYVRILNELREKNPNIKFLLENVKMKKWVQDAISRYLGVEPIKINSNLVSAQNRERYYWTNIDFNTNIPNKGLVLKDILEKEVEEKYFLSDKMLKFLFAHTDKHKSAGNGFQFIPKNGNEKANTLTARSSFSATDNGIIVPNNKPFMVNCSGGVSYEKTSTLTVTYYKGVENHGSRPFIAEGNRIRKLTPIECERLQTVTEGYTSIVSDSQAYKMLGNGWTVDVIAHIFKGLKNKTDTSRRVSLSLFDTPSVPKALTLL